MARMFLMCGHPGSGKSTYARELARKNGFRYLSIDDMYATFNGLAQEETLKKLGVKI